MYRYKVGQLYNPKRTSWPEASQLTLSPGGVELLLFFAGPTDREVDAVRRGEARFALLAGQAALILAYRFDPGIPWSDAVWQAARQTDRPVGIQETTPGEHLLTQTIMVDASTGIIRAMRATTWPHRLASAVHTAIASQQQNADPGGQLGDGEVNGWYARYPTTEKLVRAADISVRGGQPASG